MTLALLKPKNSRVNRTLLLAGSIALIGSLLLPISQPALVSDGRLRPLI